MIKYLSNASLTALLGLIKSKFATKTEVASKQDKLTFDTTPTAGSANPVTSGGVKSALDNKLSLTGGTLSGTLNAPAVQTGSAEENYFQCRKFRGEGNANTYYHAIDFGYAGHDAVDFYEYGGIWNFWKNTSSNKGGTLVGSIQSTGWNGNVVGNVTGNLTGTASKAVADAKENNIVDTYATKTSLNSYLKTTDAASTYLTQSEFGTSYNELIGKIANKQSATITVNQTISAGTITKIGTITCNSEDGFGFFEIYIRLLDPASGIIYDSVLQFATIGPIGDSVLINGFGGSTAVHAYVIPSEIANTYIVAIKVGEFGDKLLRCLYVLNDSTTEFNCNIEIPTEGEIENIEANESYRVIPLFDGDLDLDVYLTKTDASTTYATKTSLNSYLTTSDASSTYLTKSESGEFVTQTGLREVVSPTYPVTKFNMEPDFTTYRRIGIITVQNDSGLSNAIDLHFKLKITFIDTTFSVNDETLVADISSDGNTYRLSSFSEGISASDEDGPLGLCLVPGSTGKYYLGASPEATISFLSSQLQTYDLQSGYTVSFEFDRALPTVTVHDRAYFAEFRQHLSSIDNIQMYFPDYTYANDKYAQKTELLKTEYAFDITD